MAGADTQKVRLDVEEIHVPENLIKGNKFLKWDEDSVIASPVTLKVDPHGHFLYWKFQNKDVDCLELTQLRDTRTGRYAMLPKEGKLRDMCNMGSKDMPLEDKTITVISGSDMVNLTFINFCANSDKVAQEWCEHLLKLAFHRAAQNPSPAMLLRKIHTKITLMVNRDGQIPVKNIRKMFSSGAGGDKKKVENALQVAGVHVHSGKDDTIDPKMFSFDVFFTFYLQLANHKEVDKLFQAMGAKKKPYLNTDQLVNFLNNQQRDPRLNEILYPFYDSKQASAIIEKFEKKQFAKKGHMTVEGLSQYLLSHENQVVGPESYLLAQDMEQPVAHYFIKSSHNTYLTGHQFTGKSSVEIYRQVLLSGCRCVELDCWDGKGDNDTEPIITHGYTMCTEVPFKEVIEAINESAFKTSDYPVILSFENHCSQKQQAKMAQYCRTIFGDKLLIDPLDDFPIESGKPLPTPTSLKNKILVKNKKRKITDAKKRPGKGSKTIEEAAESSEQNGEGSLSLREGSAPSTPEVRKKQRGSEGRIKDGESTPSQARKESRVEDKTQGDVDLNGESGDTSVNGSKLDGLDDVDEESDSDDEEQLSREEALKKLQEKKDRGTAGQEAEAGAEMSALVNYIQPVHFSSFETSEKKNRSYEISSFVETSAMNRVKENPVEFVNYNKRQLSRIYPKGTRVDSSNYMPQIFWNVGCQLVALNYQQLDLPMQLNLGLFEVNGRTGYILKPDFMRRKDKYFDPFAESTVDGIVAATVEIRIISGQFLSDKKIGTYVEVNMFGLPADTVRRRFKTKTVANNGLNPQYDEEPFVFKKLIMPKLAMMRITVYDDNNKQLGHRILPVETLRPGYRHITLRNELYQPLMMPSLFVHIKASDYVPKGLADFASALVNPIQHQSQLDEEIKKRAEALSILIEETMNNEAAAAAAAAAARTASTAGEKAPETTTAPAEDGGVNFKVEDQSEVTGEQADQPTELIQSEPTNGNATAEQRPSNASVERAREMLAQRDSIDVVPPAVKKGSRPSRQSAMVKDSISGGGLLRSVSMGTSQFQSDAFAGFHNQSLRSRSTPNLVPAEEIIAATADEVIQHKKYQRVKGRLDTELQKLVKKQEKKQSKLKKGQEKELNKVKSAQDKAKRKVEKKNAALEKKSTKSKKTSVEDVKLQITKSMETFEQEQEKEMLKKQVAQEDALIELYKRHYAEEQDLKKEHAEMLFELQMDLMAAVHEKQLKKLDAQHKKIEQDLRKMLGSKNIEEMKNISKMKREKQEINRLKREARKKHIDQAVTERSHLINLQEKKKDELKETMKDLQQALASEEDAMMYQIEKEYKMKCQQLIKDRKYQRLSSNASNGSVGAILDATMESIQEGDKESEIQNEVNGDMTRVHDTPPSGSNGIGGSGLISGEVQVHASLNGHDDTSKENSSQAEVQSNGDVSSGHGNVVMDGDNIDGDDNAKETPTGESSRVSSPGGSPAKDMTAVVETTKL